MRVLPPEARESSGVVMASAPGSWWTHNDSGWPAELIRVDSVGTLLDRVQVTGARNVDWEDLAAGPCPAGVGGAGAGAGTRPTGRCLYIADTGDNREVRTNPSIYRVREPEPGASASDPADRFRVGLPHGPRDIEAILLLPDEELLLVTKGRNDPIEVYHVRLGGGNETDVIDRGATVIAAERVQTLTERSVGLAGYLTGGAAAPTAEGGWIAALRGYQDLRFYHVGDEARGEPALIPIPGARVNLLSLREPQGEAVTFAGDGRVVLTSEGGLFGGPASLRELDCSEGFATWGVTPLSPVDTTAWRAFRRTRAGPVRDH